MRSVSIRTKATQQNVNPKFHWIFQVDIQPKLNLVAQKTSWA